MHVKKDSTVVLLSLILSYFFYIIYFFKCTDFFPKEKICLKSYLPAAKLAVTLANSVGLIKCLRVEPQLLFSVDSEQPPWQLWLHGEGQAPQVVVC